VNLGTKVGTKICMDSLLARLDSLEYWYDVFNPGDSIFNRRSLQVIALHAHRLFGAGPPLVTTFFSAGRECHSLTGLFAFFWTDAQFFGGLRPDKRDGQSIIEDSRLVQKAGGRRGEWPPWTRSG
jgi:hypothetical protein